MARGNYRADRSYGCQYCGCWSRDEGHRLHERGNGSNIMYLCDIHVTAYDKKIDDSKKGVMR